MCGCSGMSCRLICPGVGGERLDRIRSDVMAIPAPKFVALAVGLAAVVVAAVAVGACGSDDEHSSSASSHSTVVERDSSSRDHDGPNSAGNDDRPGGKDDRPSSGRKDDRAGGKDDRPSSGGKDDRAGGKDDRPSSGGKEDRPSSGGKEDRSSSTGKDDRPSSRDKGHDRPNSATHKDADKLDLPNNAKGRKFFYAVVRKLAKTGPNPLTPAELECVLAKYDKVSMSEINADDDGELGTKFTRACSA